MNKILSDQSDWDELLEAISEKQITPIIGKELYKFTEADALTPFDEYLSKQLLQASNRKRPAALAAYTCCQLPG